MPIYDDIWAGPGRNFKRVDSQPQVTSKWYVTIHNTSNDATARAEANYAKVRTDGVGAHYFIDNIEVLQSTDTDWCVGHVGSTQGNTRGISYEITGINAWTRNQWLANVAWGQLAAVIARDCGHFGIPVRLLTLDQMRAFNSSNKGFVTHDMCRLAWGGTTHTDPGPGFPMDHLLALVGQLNGDDMSWEEIPAGGNNFTYGQITLGTNVAVWKAVGLLEALAPKLGLDPEELAAVTAAAKSGAEAGALAAADEIAAAIVAALPDTDLTRADVETAVRRVLGSLDGATPQA